MLYVVKSDYLSNDMLIGLDLIKDFRLRQDENLHISQKDSANVAKYDINSQNPGKEEFKVNFNEFIEVNNFECNLDHLKKEKKCKIFNLIEKYKSIFAKDKFDIGTVRYHEACIKLIEHRYISRKPYRCTIEDQKEIEAQILKLLEVGLIEESVSPFAASVTLAYKKDENGISKKNRLCIDFTELNKLIVPDSHPFPLIDDLIVKTRDCTWFSTFDINSAFWSIPLRCKDRYKTGFVTQNGQYQWTCLPFGLKTSPAIFQRILRNIIRRNGLDAFCANYIDDIIVFSKTFEDHVDHIECLLQAILKEGFRLKLLKCNFAKSNVKYLGHIVENNLTRPIFDNVLPIKNFPVPKNKKNIRQFLGKVNFYKKYIPRAAQLLDPLHNLLRKDVDFIWSRQCHDSFCKVKDLLCTAPCLAIFDPNKETILQTDASLDGLGAILKQRQTDGSLKPVAYFSKKLNTCQKRKKAVFF